MNELIEFDNKDIKPIRTFYNLLWIGILALTGLLLLFVWQQEPILFKPESEYIKSIVVIILLATIPAVFGWFTMQVRKIRKLEHKSEKLIKYYKIWKIRALTVGIDFILVILAYILILDKSMTFMVAIAAFVFMYCRPAANTLKNELNEIPKY